MALIEVKLRPLGPWRPGHAAGDRERVDAVYHSDALFSAMTHAMRSLGWMEEWLDATARAAGDPVVRLSSLFPFSGKTRLVAPPKSSWPPSQGTRLYLHGISLVPLEVVKSGMGDDSRWNADGESGCLLPSGSSVPFRVVMRSAAAVDRLGTGVEPHRTACLEFAPNAGFWGVFQTSDKTWEARVKSAFRLLADSGFGGERSRGWGRSAEPTFSDAGQLFGQGKPDGLWWLLSLYSPDSGDAIDWSKSEYEANVRAGWTDSPSGTARKKHVRLLSEGSVLSAPTLRGRAVDVAPDCFPHPVWRNGFALAIPLPAIQPANVGQPFLAAAAFQAAITEQPVQEPEVAVQLEALVQPEALVEPEALVQPEALVEPEAVVQPEVALEPELVFETEPPVEPEVVIEAEPVLSPEIIFESGPPDEPAVDVPEEVAQ